jgi:hypothetical protein
MIDLNTLQLPHRVHPKWWSSCKESMERSEETLKLPMLSIMLSLMGLTQSQKTSYEIRIIHGLICPLLTPTISNVR